MICDKKAYPDLRKDCEVCSEKDACFNGHAVGIALAQPIPEFQVGGIVSGQGIFVDVNNPIELIPNTEGRQITENIISAILEVMKNVKENNIQSVREFNSKRY